jgi:hypothetical protein
MLKVLAESIPFAKKYAVCNIILLNPFLYTFRASLFELSINKGLLIQGIKKVTEIL